MSRSFAYFAVLTSLAFLLPNVASAVLLTNSGFDGPEVLDLGDVTRNPITLDASDTWLLGGHDGGSDDWDIGGGTVALNDSGGESQGLVQWVSDGGSTTGVQTLSFDYKMASGSADYDLYLYLVGWNAGDTAPGVDYENGTVQTGDSFIPNDSVNLITDPTGAEGVLILAENGAAVFTGVVDDGAFHNITVNTDFGIGYDFVAIVFHGENGNGTMELDNVDLVKPIPEPSTYLVFGGLFAAMGIAGWYRKRRKQAA